MHFNSPCEFKAFEGRNFYISALDPEDPRSTEVRRIEMNLLETYGFFGDRSDEFASTAFLEAHTPRAMHEAIDAIGERTSRASFATLSGHGRSDAKYITMTQARIEEAPGIVKKFANLLRNVEVVFIATCYGGKHLRHYMKRTPGTDSQRPILIGYNGTLSATRSVLASTIIQRTIEAGVDLREGYAELALPGKGFRILYPGGKKVGKIRSISEGRENLWNSLAKEHLASL